MIFHAMESARVGSVAEVVAVGDTPLDLQAGTNAGFKAILVHVDARQYAVEGVLAN